MAKGDIISRLKLESGEFDAKIKRAGQELLNYAEHCRKMGLQMGYANRDAKEFAKALGNMQTVSQTARGKINELSDAFVNAKVMYKNMTDEEKKGEFGKNLAASLDQLKTRLNAAKKDLSDVQSELNGSKFGQFGSVIDTLGNKLGLTANATELLTSKTALLTGAVGAGIAIVAKSTEAWAKYNAELAKQDQITVVTTGLKDDDAKRMTDTMRALSDTYQVDFRDAINAANTLMSQFGVSGDEAIRLIKDGMKGMIYGDGGKLLSMIQQYAPAFQSAGVSASQLVAVIHNSEGGIFTDQNMNAIVMGIKNIRLMTKSTSEALAKLGLDGQDMAKKMSNGSMTVFDALKLVAGQLKNVDSNSQAAGEVMQTVFGRQGAMAGTNLAKAIEGLNTDLEKTKKQLGDVGDAYDELQTANEKLNTAIRDCFEYDGWEQMATGIKSKLVSALAAVLQKIADIKGALGGFSVGQQQGDTRKGGGSAIDRMIKNLGDGKSQGKKVIYQKQMGNYTSQIFRINDQIAALQQKAAEDMDGNMSLVYEKQIRTLENRKAAIQKNMAEYDRRAQALFNGNNQSSSTTTDPTSPTTPRTTNKTSTVDKEAEQTARMLAELRKQEAKATKEIADARAREHRTETTGTSGFNEQTVNAWTAMMKDQLSKADFGSVVYNSIEENMRDMTTITDLTKEALKRGLDPQSLGLTELFETAFDNIDVPDSTLQAIVEKINAAIKDGVKLEINAESGKVTGKKQEKKNDTLGDTKKVVSGLSQVAGGLQQMGIVIPEGIQNIIGVFNGVMSVVEGISTIISMTQTPALVANTVAMDALTTALWATGFFGFSQGGIVPTFANGGLIGKAAGGMLIPGNSFSGDNLRMPVDGGRGFIGVNSGELILNRAQQANLASQLQGGGGQTVHVVGKLSGESLFLCAENWAKRTGRGEFVTWR